ncbi:unnamed protein product [Cylindrotheca closterium]|uniref:Uncharacterized protein n=1 Tax=Cylindrotheca closterium TaxID=2856 RepID=A0AAD2FP22_9STRA|nr:unnamed protein product [Cylindrotheca closterium]CAJ1956639.1 unnamed protein product [Cylindrotheca closterium]
MRKYNDSDCNICPSIASELDLSSLLIEDSIPTTIGNDESNGSFSTVDTNNLFLLAGESSFSSLNVEVSVPRSIKQKSRAGTTRKPESKISSSSSTHSRRSRKSNHNSSPDKYDQVGTTRRETRREASFEEGTDKRQQLRRSCENLSLIW